MVQGETSPVWALLKLAVTLAVFGGIAYTVMVVTKAINEGVAYVLQQGGDSAREPSHAGSADGASSCRTTKDHLGKKGISISKSG